MRKRVINGSFWTVVFLLTMSFARMAAAQNVPGCGSLANSYGPFDYRAPGPLGMKNLHFVETYHFTPEVARLVRGKSSTRLIADLDFTLRTFPNHYFALQSVERYALSGGAFLSERPAECYFKRAVAFRPDDYGVRTIYGNYLLRCTKLRNEFLRRRLQCAGYVDPGYMDPRVLRAAREQYNIALKLAPTSAEVNYNAALFYLELNELNEAKRLAAVAYGAGYPLMGLKKELQAAEAEQKSPRP